MYYGLIVLSVLMFGANFALNDVYRRVRGSSVRCSLEFTLFGSIAGMIVLFIFNGIKLEITPFALIMAIISSVNGFLFTFCAFKALGSINLSLYSLFSMLGGMLLPFVQGIVFYNEALTVEKILCLLFIFVALLFTLEKGKSKGGTVYYIGIFVLNGLSGVIAKLYNTAPFEKASAAGYSVLTAMCSILISGVLLLFFVKGNAEEGRISLVSLGISSLGGAINRVANYILMISLLHVDSSVQYPMVTGGVIIVSTVICFFGKNKPRKREIISVALSFIGLLIMFLLPIALK